MQTADAVQSLAALAQATRLEIFRALVVAGPQGLTPGTMAGQLGLSPAGLSFHLKELSHAGLISAQREGRFLIYRARYEQMNALLAYLTENCCAGSACTPPLASPACAC